MKRADRRGSNDDNANKFPRSRKPEPTSRQELEQLLISARYDRDRLKEKVQQSTGEIENVKQEARTWEEKANQNQQLFLDEQQKHQLTLQLYEKASSQKQQYFDLYEQEKITSIEWSKKYQEAESQKQSYLTLYQQTKEDLQFERRSKAGIKGWETRRKRENERLKQEIYEMTILVQESLARKDEAVNNLDILAERIDRIQGLVDSVENESSSNPIGLIEKFKRIWAAIREILAE